MRDVRWKAYGKQFDTIADLKSPARAFVGGYGAGKTKALVMWAFDRALRNPPGSAVLLVEPTWAQVKKVLVPELRALFEGSDVAYTVNKSDWTFQFEDRTIWCASGEIPENISGMTVACAGIDEPAIQDEEVDRRVSSRLRDPNAVVRQIAYFGTHEGLGWVYKKTQTVPTVVVPSWENPFLPPDFLHRLRDRFAGDEMRFRMYVKGEAMSLQGGIYSRFAERHRRRCDNPKEGTLVVGADFNVGFMCWPVCRLLKGELHVIGEVISKVTNTEEHCERVKDYLVKRGLARQQRGQFGTELVDSGNQRVDLHMDATATQRRTAATKTDKAIVKDAGFWPRCPTSNPAVRDRIETVQYALGHDLLFVDPDAAPFTAKALKEHAYAKNSDPPAPQKKFGENEDPLDAATDALGYAVMGVSSVLRSSGLRFA